MLLKPTFGYKGECRSEVSYIFHARLDLRLEMRNLTEVGITRMVDSCVSRLKKFLLALIRGRYAPNTRRKHTKEAKKCAVFDHAGAGAAYRVAKIDEATTL